MVILLLKCESEEAETGMDQASKMILILSTEETLPYVAASFPFQDRNVLYQNAKEGSGS